MEISPHLKVVFLPYGDPSDETQGQAQRVVTDLFVKVIEADEGKSPRNISQPTIYIASILISVIHMMTLKVKHKDGDLDLFVKVTEIDKYWFVNFVSLSYLYT